MRTWQVIVLVFFVALPVVLMVDYWGDERLDSHGRPLPRRWHHSPRAGSDRAPTPPGVRRADEPS